MALSPLFARYISRAIYYTNFRKALVDEKKYLAENLVTLSQEFQIDLLN
jgi:hypothetical protein